MRGIFIFSLLLTATVALGVETVHDDELGMSVTPPAGFTRTTPPTQKARLAFQRGEPGHSGWAIIAFEPLSGTIGREPLDREAFERGVKVGAADLKDFKFEYGKTRWHDFELDLAQFHAGIGGIDVVSFAVTVPLQPHALNVEAMGVSGDDEARLRKDLESTLATVDGKSNWLSDAERSERLGFLVGLIVGIPLAIWLAVWVKRRRARA